MSEEPKQLTKEEWRQKVMAEGRDEVSRQEMIRLGFWKEKPITEVEQAQIEQEEAELKTLQAELNQLKRESNKLGNVDELLKEARKKRIEESQRRREKRKKERARREKDAKQRWKEYQTTHVVHAGEGVSADLQSVEYEESKLMSRNLPLLRSALELATELGISMSKLKWLTYHRGTATISHYTQFTIPKKSGGTREISAPKSDLRQVQTWIKEQILDQIEIDPRAFGFVKGRSTVAHASEHVGRAAVVKMDLADFFPSITFHRVKGLFRSFGYSGQISTLLALLCTEPPRQKVKFDGKYYYVAMDQRALPQGACTSPAITNILCRRLDTRLTKLAEEREFTYSRYADDLTFSCAEAGLTHIGSLLSKTASAIQFEGFQINAKKTRVLRASARQKVTGVVVNEKPNISRKDLRSFRAMLHNVEKNGIEQENRAGHPDFLGYLKGYASYVAMVRPDLRERLMEQIARIEAKQASGSVATT